LRVLGLDERRFEPVDFFEDDGRALFEGVDDFCCFVDFDEGRSATLRSECMSAQTALVCVRVAATAYAASVAVSFTATNAAPSFAQAVSAAPHGCARQPHRRSLRQRQRAGEQRQSHHQRDGPHRCYPAPCLQGAIWFLFCACTTRVVEKQPPWAPL
jgi:hypothetical protein